MKAVLESTAVREAALGKRPLRKLFTKEQRAFYAEHALDGIGLDDLSILGPIFVLKLKFTPKEFPRKLVAEMWLYPDGSRVLELHEVHARRCLPGRGYGGEPCLPDRAGVNLSGEQETKTRRALEYFRAAAGRSSVAHRLRLSEAR